MVKAGATISQSEKTDDPEGIFCVEGEWERELDDRTSVRQLVEFISDNNHKPQLRPIYRRVATKESFGSLIKRWKEYPQYRVGYFAFHGDKGRVALGPETATIKELGRMLGDCSGKHIVLSSCKTLAVPENEIKAFRQATKARPVSGYTKSPDWIESSALDAMLISSLLYYDKPAKTKKWLGEMCGGLVSSFGLVMNYRTRHNRA